MRTLFGPLKNLDNMPSVLLIEDDEFLSDIYLTKFKSAGFQVYLAQDGDDGLSQAHQENPDVILLDVVMPRKDGFEVLKNLRADKDFSKTKIILLTNLGQKSDVDKGLRLGADAYIIKAHYTPTEVVSRVLEIINNRKKNSS